METHGDIESLHPQRPRHSPGIDRKPHRSLIRPKFAGERDGCIRWEHRQGEGLVIGVGSGGVILKLKNISLHAKRTTELTPNGHEA